MTTSAFSKWTAALALAVLAAALLGPHDAAGFPQSVPREAANATGSDTELQSALTRAGKILSPDLEGFDYSILAQDVDDAGRVELQQILASHDEKAAAEGSADDAALQEELMRASARRPGNRQKLAATHIQRLHEAAVFAGAVYCAGLDNGQCGSKHCRDPAFRNAKVVRDIVSGATRAFISVREATKEIIVAYRGSANVQNWLDNLNFIKVAFPYASGAGSVHRGFLDTYNRVRSQVHKTLAEVVAAHPDFTVVFTGHSLGGAVATLAAADMAATLALAKPRVALVTIGSPRAGDAHFAEWLAGTHLGSSERIVQANDLVPHVPPMAFGFSHPSAERYVFKNRDVYGCNGLEDKACSNSRVPFLSITAHGRFLDHAGWFFGDIGCN